MQIVQNKSMHSHGPSQLQRTRPWGTVYAGEPWHVGQANATKGRLFARTLWLGGMGGIPVPGPSKLLSSLALSRGLG